MILNYQEIAKLGEIATLLEVSGFPKPGNVHRTQNFDDMKYEDFLISSVSIREYLEIATYNASKFYPNVLSEVKIGSCILGCIESTQSLVETNTNLGISMLLVPLAASCGALHNSDSIETLPYVLDTIMRNTTSEDAVALVKAITLANAGGLDDKTDKYDVNNENTIQEIIDNDVNIYDLLEMSAKRDKISYELINGMPVISKIGYPAYVQSMDKYSKNDATLETYLTILANVPDTLITRKYGEEVAFKISHKAKSILESTEIASKERLNALKEFDVSLRKNKYNPGTTADFTAASIFIALVDKYFNKGL